MKLDPTQTKSWQAFLDLLRPLAGYRLEKALGSTYGLSFDALVAALLAMDGRSAEEVARSPVDSIIAATRLAQRVRILFHPGSIGGRIEGLPTRLLGVLDTLLVPVDARSGLFHPKVWALVFRRLGRPEQRGQPDVLVRIVVSSRNLTRSRAFELGAVIDGQRAETPSPVARDTAAAIEQWLGAARAKAAMHDLIDHLRHCEVIPPAEGETLVRLHHQGFGDPTIAKALPARLGRAVLVSPFVRADFLNLLLDRTDTLFVVSTVEALSKLDAPTRERFVERQRVQRRPALFVVDELGDPEDAVVDGVHAKLLVAEDGERRVTLLGSANGTGPGWGIPGGGNVEAMLELRPGLGVDAFLRGFVFGEKRALRAWIREFHPDEVDLADAATDPAEELLATLKRIGVIRLEVRYDSGERALSIGLARGETVPSTDDQVELSLAPLALIEREEAFVPMGSLSDRAARFTEVAKADVSGFVALRARRGAVHQIRVTLADLRVARDLLDERDEAVRASVLEQVSPEELFRALVLGTGYSVSSQHSTSTGGTKSVGARGRSWFERVPLERVLRAVAEDPSLVGDVRRLLGAHSDDAFRRFCDDLEQASNDVKVP